VLTENQNDFNTIDQVYPYRNVSQYETEITENSISKMQQTPITKMVIISKNHKEKLALLKKTFRELKQWKFDAKKEFVYHFWLEDKTWMIVINQQESSLDELMKRDFVGGKLK
jgi:ribosome-binding ATPase YchF (GTP1/OBG family)